MSRITLKKDIFTISNISIFSLFLLMLWSMNPWFAWYHTNIIVAVLSGSFILLRLVLVSEKYQIAHSVLIVMCFAVLLYIMLRLRYVRTITTIPNFIRVVLLFIFVITMRKNEQTKIVLITTNVYALIVGISLIAYFMVIIGVRLPYSLVVNPHDVFYPPFQNYKILIMPHIPNLVIRRFQSIFTEPGHLAMISALLLYINRYDLKKKSVFVIFLSIIMSLSLAGYVLLILGYVIQMIAKSKYLYKTLFKIFIGILLLFIISLYFYIMHPESVISIRILSRFELDENRGIRGNNRTTDKFNRYYETQFLTSPESILWGANLTEFEYVALLGGGGNNSYKLFILLYGSISLILLFLMYFSIVAIKPSKLGFGLLVLYGASFLQRTYALWDIQLFLFIGTIQYFHIKSPDYVINSRN